MDKKEIGQALLKALAGILEKKSPPGRSKEVEELKAKGLPASEAFGIAWKQHDETKKAEMVAAAKKNRPCRCKAYFFPHRSKGGACRGE